MRPEVIVRPYEGFRFEVIEDYSYRINVPLRGSEGAEIVEGIVHRNYTTDGASVPRIFWIAYPPFKAVYFTPCVIHDFMCSRAMHFESRREGYDIADRAFKQALKDWGNSKLTVFLFYNYVNIHHKIKCFLKGWQ